MIIEPAQHVVVVVVLLLAAAAARSRQWRGRQRDAIIINAPFSSHNNRCLREREQEQEQNWQRLQGDDERPTRLAGNTNR